MDSERWKQVDNLLQSVLQRPLEERDAFLRDACAGDEALEREVRSLLSSALEAGSFLDSPAIEVAARAKALRQDADSVKTKISMTSAATNSEVTRLAASGPAGFAGQTFSHYKILEKLGAGGMGVVYKAFDTKLGRHVALKFLPPHMSDVAELKQRLTEEARAASALDHPNIVVIHDIDESPGGELFIAMAFHDGMTLREKIAGGLTVSEALQIARQIASGLAKAHEHRIFHRDIKPSNIMVAKDGVARIIDFGLAKSSEATATVDGSTKGTPLYMSPEQAAGKAVDFRTDLWSVGAVLYEMLAGKPPFRGDSQLRVMHAIVNDTPPRLREVRPDLPAAIDAIVSRALEKDPANRYQSAAELARHLSAAIAALESPTVKHPRLRAAYAIPALVMVLLAAGAAVWFYQRSEKRHWAHEQAIPEINRLLAERKPVAAFLLLRKAEQYLPGDSQLAQIEDGSTHIASVKSTPPGASVEIKDYLSPGDPWLALGTTPLDKGRIPTGYLRWRLSKSGVGEYVGAPIANDIHGPIREFNFHLEAINSAPKGMVPVPAVHYEDYVWSIGGLGPFDLPAFYIDRFEVTNQQYQDFVDNGGYQKREYWKEKLLRDGKELSWEQAIDLFRDSTGRTGPATWRAGHYPDGQGEYPVGGVSWYEASAYAEFVGKSLPVIAQWYFAAPSSVAKYIVGQSNYSNSPAPVGKFQGVGPWGTYDMAGNIAEWCRNESGGNSRYILGGAWNTSSSEYFEPGQLPPFDRSSNGGFRCVRNTGAVPAAAMAGVRPAIRDLSKAKPASDELFRVYKGMYAYDHTPLNVKTEPVGQDSTDWHKEKVTFDAAYGNERMAAYLFVPTKVRPPYQTVVFFPSARVLDITNSKILGDMQFIDYVIQSGRAVLYPVYKGTYERPGPDNTPTTAAGRELLIQESKDIGRSIDYLETRTDIDMKKIAYMGVSMGAALGVVFTTVEDRFRTVIFLDGGLYAEKLLPGTDQADFAPRLKAPTLLIAGKFDWIFLGKDALVRMLGAPPADKKVVMFDTAHDVSEQRPDLMREVLAWLDKYLGKVN